MTQPSLNEDDNLLDAITCLLNNLPRNKVTAYTQARQHEAGSVEDMVEAARPTTKMSKKKFWDELKTNIDDDNNCELELKSIKQIINKNLPIKQNEHGEVTQNNKTYQIFGHWMLEIFSEIN